jgi:hypothetical protein
MARRAFLKGATPIIVAAGLASSVSAAAPMESPIRPLFRRWLAERDMLNNVLGMPEEDFEALMDEHRELERELQGTPCADLGDLALKLIVITYYGDSLPSEPLRLECDALAAAA